MILDNNLVFSNAISAALTTTTGSTVIDLSGGSNFAFGVGSVFGEDLGIGDGPAFPKIGVYVGTAMTSTNSATLQVQFQGSTDSSTWTTYMETPAMAASLLAANTCIAKMDWPHRLVGAALPRYVRLNYVVATGVFSTGTLSSYVMLQRDDWPLGLYPSGFTVGS